MKNDLNRITIHDFIPHRPPFLYVDEIREFGENRIVTTWLARIDSEFFKGHYPENPVMPGVLICECVFQSGAILIASRMKKNQGVTGFSAADGRKSQIRREGFAVTEAQPCERPNGENVVTEKGIPVITRIQDARFKRIVRPGQTLCMDVILDEELDNAYYLTGRVTVEDKQVLRVTFACMLAE